MTNISIIIATFNAAKTLSKALDSVLNQAYQGWECIIVDGASKDNTINIIKNYVQKDSRFRYVSEPDKGIFDAYNKGWKIAKGKWIYYLGADDSLSEKALNEIFASELDDCDVIYGNVIIAFSNGDVKYQRPCLPASLKYKMFACHQSILVKRAMIEKMNGFNIAYPISADFDMMQRIYLNGGKFKYVNAYIASFAYTGVSSRFSFKTHYDHYMICKHNKSNKCPLFYYLLHETRLYMGYLHKRLLNRI